MLGVAFYKTFDEGSFADTRRSDDGNDDRGSFFREAINKGDMEALFFDLRSLSVMYNIVGTKEEVHRETAQQLSPDAQDSHSQKPWDYDPQCASSFLSSSGELCWLDLP